MQLFAYGTLTHPEVMQAVTGSRFRSRPARLEGFARYSLSEVLYPGLVEEPGAVTSGVLYSGLTGPVRDCLDRFEGDWYRRTAVRVETGDGVLSEAFTYVIRSAARHRVTTAPWDPARFGPEQVRRFLLEYEGFGRIRS